MTADDWQPIASAPKDGTRFLAAWKVGNIGIVWWLKDYQAFTDGDFDRCHTPRQFSASWFTHWRPFPPPPVT